MAWDNIWEKIFSERAWGNYPGEDLIRFVAHNFYKSPDRKNIKILEIGCGPGANLWFMAREGFSVYGVDGSETAIAKARARLDSECPGWSGELIAGDMSRLPYEDNFFDGVIDNEAVCCNSFEDSKGIYRELARVTKNKGALFSRTFAEGTWGEGTGMAVGHNAWIVSEGPLEGKGYSRFTRYDEINDLLVGFSISEIELLTRTVNNRGNEIKEWIITGIKK